MLSSLNIQETLDKFILDGSIFKSGEKWSVVVTISLPKTDVYTIQWKKHNNKMKQQANLNRNIKASLIFAAFQFSLISKVLPSVQWDIYFCC